VKEVKKKGGVWGKSFKKRKNKKVSKEETPAAWRNQEKLCGDSGEAPKERCR